jgi:uncharacterized protein YukE
VRDRDFGIEYVLTHPDGGTVRYDYVDLQIHRIVDLKARANGEALAEVSGRYGEQRDRHITAYRATFGVTPTYHYSCYLSTRHLFAGGLRFSSPWHKVARKPGSGARSVAPCVTKASSNPRKAMASINLTPEEIEAFARGLKMFNDQLGERFATLKGQLGRLSEHWQDESHRAFAEQFRVTMQEIEKFQRASAQHYPYLIRKAQKAKEARDVR